MNSLTQFFIGPFLVGFPIVVTAVIFSFAVFLYLKREKVVSKKSKLLNFRFIIILAVAFVVLNAAIYTFAQYLVWSQPGFTNTFLKTPLNEAVPPSTISTLFPALFQSDLGYFFFYSWGRFWLKPVILLSVSYGFWAFLKLLKKHKDRYFDTGEVELGLIMSILVGWPNFVIFIPLVFLFVVLVSIFRGIFLKEAYTTLGWPFIIAGGLTIVFGDYLIQLFNLGVLRI